jgi:hypothetical protein
MPKTDAPQWDTISFIDKDIEMIGFEGGFHFLKSLLYERVPVLNIVMTV